MHEHNFETLITARRADPVYGFANDNRANATTKECWDGRQNNVADEDNSSGYTFEPPKPWQPEESSEDYC